MISKRGFGDMAPLRSSSAGALAVPTGANPSGHQRPGAALTAYGSMTG